ncbi:MAG: nuclear transport factor 2 family protein [Gaiellaceae bacterium]
MNTEALAARWRETWERAWPLKDSASIAALYAGDAVYRSHPFREPERSARDYVERVFAEEEAVECRFGEPVVTGERAAVEWWASWQEAGEDVTLAGVTIIRFGDDGLVVEHLDYWVQGDGRIPPFPAWGGA